MTVYTDSTASIGISSRQGLGKLRHLDTTALWIQQAIRSKRITLRKVSGEENPADVYTKHMPSREKLTSLMRLYDCDYRPGRAESAPLLRREQRLGTEIRQADGRSALQTCYLPHTLGIREREELHPRIEAAEEIETFEAELSGRSYLEEAGAKIAEEIEDEARRCGRRAGAATSPRASPQTSSSSTAFGPASSHIQRSVRCE